MELSSLEKDYFKELFKIADADKDGKIGTKDAPPFFQKALIEPSYLSKIWSLSDTDNKGYLTEEEFYIALRLIVLAQEKKELSRDAAKNPVGKLPIFPDFPPSSLNFTWTISAEEKQKYYSIFKMTDTNNDGYITGEEARILFGKSGLSSQDLAKIWFLSDIDGDQQLDLDEFVIAMFLINLKLKKKIIEIPNILPKILIPPSKQQSIWIINNEEKKKYEEIFKQVVGNGEPFITGEQAKVLFGRSGLNSIDLGKIWVLSDMDKDHKLNEYEFIVAMFLINSKLRGINIPETLPESLKNLATPPISKLEKPKANYNINLNEFTSESSSFSTSNNSNVNLLQNNSFEQNKYNTQPMTPQLAPLTPSNFSNTLRNSNFSSTFDFVASTPSSPFPNNIPNTISNSKPSSPIISQINPVMKLDPTQITGLQEKKEELNNQLKEETELNKELEKQLLTEQGELDELTKEIKLLDQKVLDEKTKGMSIKEKLKYTKLQIQGIKEQKEHYESVLKEKLEQITEGEEMLKVLELELTEKNEELDKLKEEIKKLTIELDTLKKKRNDTRNQIFSVKQQTDQLYQNKKKLEEEIKQNKLDISNESKPITKEINKLKPFMNEELSNKEINLEEKKTFDSSNLFEPFNFSSKEVINDQNLSAKKADENSSSPFPKNIDNQQISPFPNTFDNFNSITSHFDNDNSFGKTDFTENNSNFIENHNDSHTKNDNFKKLNIIENKDKIENDDPFHYKNDLLASDDLKIDVFGNNSTKLSDEKMSPSHFSTFNTDLEVHSQKTFNEHHTFSDSGFGNFDNLDFDLGKDSFG